MKKKKKKIEIMNRATKWLMDGETGVSSQCLCAALFGIKPNRVDIPHDSGDFRRCLKFLELFTDSPETVKKIWDTVAEFSPKWRAVRDNWSELVSIYESDESDNHVTLYKRLSEIRLLN